MNNKIKILCIILSVIYIVFIVKSLAPGVEIFRAIVEIGEDSARKNTDYSIFHFNVMPKNHSYTFPSTVTNTISGTEMEAEVLAYKVKMQDPSKYTTTGNILMFTLKFISSIAFLFLIIYLPILFFKITIGATKGNIIESKVIKNISRMGWLLSSMFVLETLVIWLDLITAKQLIELEHYRMVMDFSGYYLLILGLVTLLLAEVLKVSLNMKEEQELTI